jgi:Ca2+-binding RTX toxin-like protein
MQRLSVALVATIFLLPAALGTVAPTALALALTCDGQPATIVGTAAADTLVGTPAADVIVGLSSKDTISGLGGNDRLCGGRGVDTIDAGGGDDIVYGGADGFAVSIEGDFVEGGPGDDELHGGLDPAESGGQQKNEDIVIYEDAPSGVQINLGSPTVTGQGLDTIDGWNTTTAHQTDLRKHGLYYLYEVNSQPKTRTET